jgi:hypothetical protein
MIDDARRDAIFAEMDSYILKLDPSTAGGSRYFIDKIAICRNYLNNVSLVLSELQKEKLITRSELSKLQTMVEMENATLLATDEHVRRLASIKDRESMVLHMQRPKLDRINELKDQILAIDGIMKYVSLRNRELRDTMDSIKNQRRFMQIEVQTGAFYGDERLPGHERNVALGPNGQGAALIMDATEGDDALAEMTAALEEAANGGAFDVPGDVVPPAPAPSTPEVAAVPAPEPVVDASGDDAVALARFLGDSPVTDELSGASKPAPVVVPKSPEQAEIDDLSSLLDNV